jgi:hypothetical protein
MRLWRTSALKAMEDENRRLKLLVAELSPAWRSAEGHDPKKRLELAGLRGDIAFVSEQFRLSARTACKLLGMERSSYRYELRPQREVTRCGGAVGAAEAALRLPVAFIVIWRNVSGLFGVVGFIRVQSRGCREPLQ